MGGRNLARVSLTVKKLNTLDPGTRVIDADMDIYVRRADGLWYPEGEDTTHRPISTVTLHRYGPIKLFPYVRKQRTEVS